jgi:hypothetical protein
MVGSLAVTARRTLIMLDRNAVTRRAARIGFVVAVATIGILLWGLALSIGNAAYVGGSGT